MFSNFKTLTDIEDRIASERGDLLKDNRRWRYIKSRGLLAFVMLGNDCISDDDDYNHWDGTLKSLKELKAIVDANPGARLMIECSFDGAKSPYDYLQGDYEPFIDTFCIIVHE